MQDAELLKNLVITSRFFNLIVFYSSNNYNFPVSATPKLLDISCTALQNFSAPLGIRTLTLDARKREAPVEHLKAVLATWWQLYRRFHLNGSVII